MYGEVFLYSRRTFLLYILRYSLTSFTYLDTPSTLLRLLQFTLEGNLILSASDEMR
jgi:hypothetical protein